MKDVGMLIAFAKGKEYYSASFLNITAPVTNVTIRYAIAEFLEEENLAGFILPENLDHFEIILTDGETVDILDIKPEEVWSNTFVLVTEEPLYVRN